MGGNGHGGKLIYISANMDIEKPLLFNSQFLKQSYRNVWIQWHKMIWICSSIGMSKYYFFHIDNWQKVYRHGTITPTL